MARWAIAAFVIAWLMPISLYAQSEPASLIITNCTNKAIYTAPYYVPLFAHTIERVGQPLQIGPYQSLTIERPYYQLGYYRYFLFGHTPSQLFTAYQYDYFFDLHPKYAGAYAGNHIYVDLQDGALCGHNSIEWYFWHPVMFGKKISRMVWRGCALSIHGLQKMLSAIKRKCVPPIAARIRMTQTAFWDVAHRAQTAHVRVGNDLCDGERTALTHRRLIVKKALRKKFGSAGYVPKVALIASGGGYRALFYLFGYLSAVQQSGVLDMITWIGTLSGSSWGLNALYTYALNCEQSVSIANFADEFSKMLSGKHLISVSLQELNAINRLLLVQAVEHQAFTSINIAGAFLANRLFCFLPPEQRQMVHLSQQAPLIESGRWPIPIYTAAHYHPEKKEQEYEWLEFTPWEVGGAWLGAYVPAWAISRRFENGVSTDHKIEKSLGYLMGIFGSVFSAKLSTMYGLFKDKLWVIVKNIIEQTIITQIPARRLWWGQIPNFTYGMEESPLSDVPYIDMVDAGFVINIPYPPLSGQRAERAPDIIIIVDASTTLHNGLALQQAEQYAQRHGLPFPVIDYADIGTRAISIFKDNTTQAPTIIYMPAIVDPSHEDISLKQELQELDMSRMVANGPYNSGNLIYSRQDSARLMSLAEHNAIHSMEQIFSEIERVMCARSG